ncbi:DUF7507 domain-containing protein [Flavobacterium ginsengiterrae]|uniref:DUF7507 domain-containing protein n=1 Tax=Flavobacterium ginsengiterrae TaxID=871695 RepID=A0ABP7GG75_9FLAO
MCPKSLLFTRSLFLKLLFIFFLISANGFGQSTVSRIYTDWRGYWTSNSSTVAGNRPDLENNLIGFSWNGKTYSTGVNDNALDTHSVIYNKQKFRALKIQTLGSTTSTYFLQGSMIDGSNTVTRLEPALLGASATGAELAARLTDGVNGLSLGTGVANIKAGTAEFKIGTNNLNTAGINDGTPDLVVTQVAEYGGTADKFKFVDASGNTVGRELSITFSSATPSMGTYSLDLFNMNGTYAFTPAATRELRMIAIETSEFDINASNAALVDRFVVTFSGSSDCAFIAFNTNSLKIAELQLLKTASISSCAVEGSTINYTFEVKNPGEVPITDIHITDPKPITYTTGNTIASLAPGATTTLTGTYTVTAADVTAGRVINSAKVTGIDPSLNVVEDISGTAFNNDVATSIDLLAPPTIGTTVNTTCTSLGTVVLNNLPSVGNWQIQRIPDGQITNGSGTSTTISGLAAGTSYTFRVTNAAGCKSPASAAVSVTNQSSTTWNGTGWSNGDPNTTKSVVFTGPYTFTANMDACSCTINSPVNLVVPTGITLNVINAVTVNSGSSLTFNNNSSLVQTNKNAVNSGNITYIRETSVRRYDYTYWSSPLTLDSNFTLFNMSPLTLADKYTSYDSDFSWVIHFGGGLTMKPGEGYSVRGPQNFDIVTPSIQTASFIGVPANGDVPKTTVPNKFNLLGNPYPSAINGIKLIGDTNIGTIYLWTHNTPPAGDGSGKYKYASSDYAAFNLSGGIKTGGDAVLPTGYIAAGQGFFAKPVTNSITFTNDMRVGSNNGNFYKTAKTENLERNRVWLNLSNAEGAFKQMLVGYIEGATNGQDLNYDAASFNGNSYIDFYSISETVKFSIQARALPFQDSDIIPLGYKSTIAGDFKISIDHVDGFFDNQNVYLEDKKTGIISDLKTADYTFKTEAGTFTDRFTLRYTNKTLGNDDFENVKDGLLISVKDKVIKVTSAKENIKEVSVFDITGKLIYNKKKVGSTELSIVNLQAGDQVLLVKVSLENNAEVNRKVIFK